MILCAARGLLRSELGEANAAATSGALATHFDVAKMTVVALQSEIVRRVLAPPERVCLEIMS